MRSAKAGLAIMGFAHARHASPVRAAPFLFGFDIRHKSRFYNRGHIDSCNKAFFYEFPPCRTFPGVFLLFLLLLSRWFGFIFFWGHISISHIRPL